MNQDTLDFLREAVAPEEALALGPFVNLLPDDDTLAGLGVLQRTRTAGGDVTLRSRRPRNLLVNWGQLVRAALGVGAGVIGAVAAPPVTGLALIGLAMAALPQLLDLPNVKLADLHTRVVEHLWRDDRGAVPCEDVRTAFDQTPDADLERALQELESLRVNEILGDVAHKRERLVGRGWVSGGEEARAGHRDPG